MKKFLFSALALLFADLPAHAQKTKAQLNTEITTNFPDNTTGLITPLILRNTTTDFVLSWVDYLTCTGTGGIVYWTGGVPTCLPAGTNGQVLTLAAGIPAWGGSGTVWPSGGGPATATSGGIPYFNSTTTILSSGLLTANNPVLGGGAGAAPIVGSRTGNTTIFATSTGALANGNCVSIDSNGNLIDAGGPCTTGGGGGTVNAGLINQLAYYAAGGTAVSGLATCNSGWFGTSAGGVPSCRTSATPLPGLIGGTGVSNSGLTITLGGNISTAGAFTTAGAFGLTLTATNTTNSTFPAGTHTLAGLDVAQTFSALNQFTDIKLSSGHIYPAADSTTAVQITKADGTTGVLVTDTTNARIGINRTPGAFDLDVNNTANVGGALTFGTATITALTNVASPVGANDYLLFWSASANGIRKCTLNACGAASTAGVTSVNALSGALTLASTGLSVVSGGSTITVGATTDTPRWAGLGIGGAAPATGIEIYNAAVAPTGNGQGIFGASATNGLVVLGQGSANDVTVENKAGSTICSVGTGGASFNCIGLQQNGNPISLAASFTTSGAAGLTLTVTGVTNATLPLGTTTIPRFVASGAKALATGAISSAACTTAQTDTATGVLTTDAIMVAFNADPTGVTGYVPSTNGMLTIVYYPTADTVNFKVCNNTSASITPGAITLNWRVVR